MLSAICTCIFDDSSPFLESLSTYNMCIIVKKADNIYFSIFTLEFQPLGFNKIICKSRKSPFTDLTTEDRLFKILIMFIF